jgi:hypothetical protein
MPTFWQHVMVTLSVLLPVLIHQWRLERKLIKLLIEHEMLIDFLCDMTGKDRSDLPTRHNGIL